MPPDVVVIGSANADLVLDVDHRPAAGETILGSDLVVTPGGKGANQAVAAGLLGGRVSFIGCVGSDGYGELLRDSLTDAGVDVSGLQTVDVPSGNAIILVTPDGENSIIVSPAANRKVTPELLEELAPRWTGAAVLVLQLEIPVEAVEHAALRTRGRVVLNAAPAAELPAEVLAVADPLVVNESEAAFLLARRAGARPGADLGAGGTNPGAGPSDLVAALANLGPRSVVLTLGSGGAAHLDKDTGAGGHVPARPVRAVDTTGAGDAFVGALAVALADGGSLAEAVDRATAVAAVAVSRRGAQASYPRRTEIDG